MNYSATGAVAGQTRAFWARVLGIPAHISLGELLRRAWEQFLKDGCLNLAAQISYFFVLSLFPFMLFLAALIGFLPFTGLWDRVLPWIMTYFPRDAQRMILDII